MSQRWHVAAAVTILFAITALTEGQSDVGVTLEPSRFTRDRTAVLRVTVGIPDGHYIPAETTGTLQGAWLQVVEGGFDVRQFPTYPAPGLARPPGATADVLAYKGTITILVPVDVAPGVTGARRLTLEFGYQLCDSIDCSPFATKTVRQTVFVDEPDDPADSLAFRIDSSRAAIVLDRHITVARNAAELGGRPLARFAIQLLAVPDTEQAGAQLRGEIGPASPWTIRSNGRTYRAVVEEPAAFAGNCGNYDDTQLTLVARVGQSSFGNEPAKYFLASRADSAGASIGPLTSASVNMHLTDSQRRELEEVIGRQLRITLPSLFAPDPRITRPGAPPTESIDDRRIREGRGRLAYHVEAFRAAPDGDPRLFVRAYWTVGARSQTGLTLWIRFDGTSFSVERSDASVSRFARYAEAKSMGLDIAARPEYAGTLLNVIPAADGWAYLITGGRGYESAGVSVWKYSPLGPQSTGVRYGYGC
jgi:hypothetical protein